jgi:uncharacterized glyoxalase superfamily protein PhnB
MPRKVAWTKSSGNSYSAGMKPHDDDKPLPMSGPEYGRTLRGLSFNLIVRDVPKAARFATEVLGATQFFGNSQFSAMKLNGGDFMFHADQTYNDNLLSGSLQTSEARGVGVELRIYNCDPDLAEANAKAGGWTVLSGTSDRPHGLRECMILDDEGFVWLPSVHVKS